MYHGLTILGVAQDLVFGKALILSMRVGLVICWIWAKATFFFEQLFPVVARTWLESKSGTSFLGPKFRFLAKKSDFCHMTPILVNGQLALGETFHNPPWERLFNFLLWGYSSFR